MTKSTFDAKEYLRKIGSLVDSWNEKLLHIYFEFNLSSSDRITIKTFSQKEGLSDLELLTEKLNNYDENKLIAEYGGEHKGSKYTEYLSKIGSILDKQKVHPLLLLYTNEKAYVRTLKPKEDWTKNELNGAVLCFFVFDEKGDLASYSEKDY